MIKNTTPKESGIYMFVNKINGHKYVGQSKNIFERIGSHLIALRKNKDGCVILQHAWNKYGEDNFCIDVLELCNKDRLDGAEAYWIKKYGTNINGYNIAPGGMGYIYEESRESLLEKQIIEDFKNSGYKYTNDCKSEKTKKYNKTQEIVCLNTGEIFKNARECCIKYPSADNSIILKCCKNIFVSGGNHCCGKDDSNNNLYWCYLGDYSEFKDKNINDIQKYFSSLKHTASRKVVCLNNNIVFDSCMDAAKFCNISVQSICDNLKVRTHTTKNGNYVFKYYDSTLNNL